MLSNLYKVLCLMFVLSFCTTLYAQQPTLTQRIGQASYKPASQDGQPTASGELYNAQDLTAAHQSLPFGTMLLVTNLSNNRQVAVRINDRLSPSSPRIIDVSGKAALELDLFRAGIANVKLDLLQGNEYNATLSVNEGNDVVLPPTYPPIGTEGNDVVTPPSFPPAPTEGNDVVIIPAYIPSPTTNEGNDVVRPPLFPPSGTEGNDVVTPPSFPPIGTEGNDVVSPLPFPPVAVNDAVPEKAAGSVKSASGIAASFHEAPRVMQGTGAVYSANLHGNRTSSNDIYNSAAMTAAHKNLPYGTEIRITNTLNNRSTTARINDRTPIGSTHEVIVSGAVAQVLGMVSTTSTPVQVEVLSQIPANSVYTGTANWTIQLVSTSTLEKANENVQAFGNDAWIKEINANGRIMYRVCYGQYQTRAEAERANVDIKSKGFQSFVRRID